MCSQLAQGASSAQPSCLPSLKQALATQTSAAVRQMLMLWGFAIPAASLGKKQRGIATPDTVLEEPQLCCQTLVT